jgi:hypothetical protein
VDPAQAVNQISAALFEGPDATEQVLRELFLHAYFEPMPADWEGVQQILSTRSNLRPEQVSPWLELLKSLAGEAGDAQDPRKFFEDPELQRYFAVAQVPPGSAIYQVDRGFYLNGDYQCQLWRVEEPDGSVYYHDGTNSYDELGNPRGASDAASPAQPEDHEKWNAYLKENGPRWDGTEEHWQQFRDWFLYSADLNHVGQSAHGFIELAEKSSDKRAVFAEYGITLPATAAPDSAGQPQPEDPEAWNAYLRENGPVWDGNEKSWQTFRDWFLYHADQNQVGQSAHGFIDLAEKSSDKREVFARYGITLPAAGAPASGAVAADDLMQRLRSEVMEPALAEVMADPQLAELAAELGEDRLHELVAEVTAAHLQTIGSVTA